MSRHSAPAHRDRPAAAHALVGASPAMCELAEQVAMLARDDHTTVLLVGEHGMGKGRIAAYIHASGPRAAQPFLEVNCAAVRGPRLELDLLGAEQDGEPHGEPHGEPRGDAFGDARGITPGMLELAESGTLFVDDIGEVDPTLQPRLLRVLEGRSFRRVGGVEEIVPRARLIAATHRDLVNEVTAGRFREDLYYRLNVMPVHLPPLRARSREDVLEVTAAVLGELARELPEAPCRVGDEAMERLLAYSWPGNVRELRNVLERAMLLARAQERECIGPELLPVEVRSAAGTAAGPAVALEPHVPRSLDDVEREHMERTLRAHEGNRTHAARELGISRATLIKKIRQYGL